LVAFSAVVSVRLVGVTRIKVVRTGVALGLTGMVIRMTPVCAQAAWLAEAVSQ
jgi:hypothetical protein